MSDVVRRAVATAAMMLAIGAPAAHAAEAPQILDPTVTKLSAREVVFTASVHPGGAETAVRLEFGRSRRLGARSETVTVPAADEPVPVTITLRGRRDSTYFWRFRAANGTGEDLSETREVRAPPRIRRKVMPVAQLSFVVETERAGSPLGRILAFTRPSGLPAGTTLTIRCRRACVGGRTIPVRSQPYSGLVRFFEPLVVRERTIVEIRAVRAGWVGRVRGYRFRRSGGLLVPVRVSNHCLTPTNTPQRTSCTGG